jgi:predicted dehydrogenase
MTRVGLIGVGYWGPNILKSLLQLDDVEICVLCDSNKERLLNIAQKNRLYGKCQLVTDYKECCDYDCKNFIVATPAFTHYEVAKTLLEANKNVLVEKPLTLKQSEALDLLKISNDRQLKLMVGHTFLYNDCVIKIKDMIMKGELGDINYAYMSRLNLGVIREDVNALWNLAPHDFSIATYLMNYEPLHVSAIGKSFINRDIEDVVFITLEFPGGQLFHIHVSWLDPSKERKLTIVGTKKMVVFDDMSSDAKLTIYDKGIDINMREMQHFTKLRAGDIVIPHIQSREPLKEEINHFIDCIKNDKQIKTDGWHGVVNVSILEAAQRSLKNNGRWEELS